MKELLEIAGKTNNDAIIIIIVLIIGIIAAYPIAIKARERKRIQHMEQQKLNNTMTRQMMSVIEKNAESYTILVKAVERLTTIIELTDINCRDCKHEQSTKMDRVLDGLNNLAILVAERKGQEYDKEKKNQLEKEV